MLVRKQLRMDPQSTLTFHVLLCKLQSRVVMN
jgi:hypothetical protein